MATGTTTTCVIGFDSAWTDNKRAPGAVCAIIMSNNGARLKPPCSASFHRALEFIEDVRRGCDACLVAVDQPTIVPNKSGSRPADQVAGSLISFIGGGVQPANRSKSGMFDDDAPIWRFKAGLDAREDPELSQTTDKGLFIIEVFPALALPAFEPAFYGRCKAPKYNPANRRKFHIDDWSAVIETVRRYASLARIEGVESWTREIVASSRPCKADQDRLDAVLCALIGHHWRAKPRGESIMIGDLTAGYMISPTNANMRARLETAAAKRGVPIDGIIPGRA